VFEATTAISRMHRTSKQGEAVQNSPPPQHLGCTAKKIAAVILVTALPALCPHFNALSTETGDDGNQAPEAVTR